MNPYILYLFYSLPHSISKVKINAKVVIFHLSYKFFISIFWLYQFLHITLKLQNTIIFESHA